MSALTQISDAVSLAFHSLAFLAQEPDRRATTREIAKVFQVSENHLAKIHQRLTQGGILQSVRGPRGGVQLTRAPRLITLMQIYRMVQGPFRCGPCVFKRPVCGRTSCIFGDLLPEINRRMQRFLSRTTLAQIVQH